MKRILTILIVTAICIPGYSAEYALDKGAVSIGGSLFFSASGGDKYENGTLNTFTMNPTVGYLILDGLSLEFNLTFQAQKDESASANGIGAGINLSYFINPKIENNVAPYIGAGIVFGKDVLDGTSVNIPISTGILVFLNKFVSLDAGLVFMIENYTADGTSSSTSGYTFLLGLGLTVFLF